MLLLFTDIEGWLNGISALGVLSINIIIGIYGLYKAGKKAKLLTVTALTIISIAFLWLGPTTDFINILINDANITPYLYPLLSYMWAAPGITLGMYIGGELLIPKKKWILVGIFIIISIAYEYFLFSSPINSFNFTIPGVGEVEDPTGLIGDGSNIIDTSSNYGYPTAYFLIVFILSILIFNGIGFLVKAKQATGILRKKFLYLASGFIVFAIIVAFDSVVPPMIAVFIVRFGIIISSILIYLGIKT
ncbi:MAG: hypothetical protein ACFE8E_01550 [Candidatus Hodarchaeota archaeon]